MGIPLIGGLIDGGSNGNKAREEEERRKREEAERAAEEAEARREAEAEAAAERAAEAERAAAEQRERSQSAFERRPVREDERGAPVLNRNPERDALDSLASGNDVPAYTMSIPEDEIRTSVTIPEDEIQFTPNAPPERPDPYARVLSSSAPYGQQATPGGRVPDFSTLDAQADAADAASRRSAAANLESLNAPQAPQSPASPVAQQGTTTPEAAPPPVAPPAGPGAVPAPSSSPVPPPATPLPQAQAQADAQQQTVQPQGSRIPLDVRTAAMPQPAQQAAPAAGGSNAEDEARRALRVERALKALGIITRLGMGAGALALDARGGSPAAAQFMASAGGLVGGALGGASPTGQQARIQQARQFDVSQQQRAEDLDMRRLAQAAAERRQMMQDQQQAQRLDLDARRVSAMEEGLGLRARQTEAQASAAEALAAERASRGQRQTEEAALEEAMLNPESEVSRQAQRELRAVNATRPERDRIPDETIAGLSANAARMLMREMSRPLGNRSRPVAGGGGGAPMSVNEARQALIERGLAPELANSLAPRELQRLLRTEAGRSMREGIGGEGREILPGVFSQLEMTSTEVAKLRDGFDDMRRGMLTLNRVGAIANEFGGVSARISPEARARINPELTLLRSMVAQMGGTGVINPSEVPTINATLPNPGDLEQMTFGSFQTRLNAWRSILMDSARSSLESRGVNAEGIERALGGLRSGFGGGGQRQARRGPERVTFIPPGGGRPLTTSDPDAIQRARDAGWEEQ